MIVDAFVSRNAPAAGKVIESVGEVLSAATIEIRTASTFVSRSSALYPNCRTPSASFNVKVEEKICPLVGEGLTKRRRNTPPIRVSMAARLEEQATA